MTTGEKLSKLRREAGYTQEELADKLGVSRQAISKWESDAAYPETEKLIKLGELYDCSMDYLLKDNVEDPKAESKNEKKRSPRDFYFEWKSKRTIKGVPLCHVNIGLGRTARGILAVGLAAKGVLAVGLLAMGLLSFGLCSIGVLAFGMLVLGGFAAGAISIGLIAFGGVCIGVIAVGGVAIGGFCVGGCAVGRYIAIGDYAFGELAYGKTWMNAGRYGIAPFDSSDLNEAKKYLEQTVPWIFGWAKNIMKWFM